MYSFESRIRYSEVDQNQELSVTGIINYLQDCSTFQSEDLNLGVTYLQEHHRAWWLSSWQIVIERYPRLGEEIIVSTWPYDFKGIYGYRNFTICDKKGNYLVKANSIWFFFDTEAGRPVRAQESDIRGYGSGEEKRLEMDYAPRRIPVPENAVKMPVITVLPHHIDTNRHVNNAQYIKMAEEYLPEGFALKEMQTEYKKAAMLHDVIVPRVAREDGRLTVALTDAGGRPYAVVVFQEKQ